ncbi:MAG: phenylalanine--tRNA ligase subunit beta [Candidatus Omnitrophica bacterium]|nr:phenylalanine--tRNA ligase subunit beta [Candidatus Omnitrophota bacterium]
MAGLEIEAIENVGKGPVFEIEITPNRPDALSMLGLAREIGAITDRQVKFPKIKNIKTKALKNLVHIENKADCGRYIATLIKQVTIKPSPVEMMEKLSSMGLKPINNAVDITNFVLMETGQPLHAFDFDKLEGGRIEVRRARSGESIVTLDGVQRKLDPSILVIADAQKPVAIAGIMGGLGTEISTSTKNILLESAFFDMGLIRQACRTLGLRSDSSYRFERQVNIKGVETGANRATDLLLQLTQGQIAGRQEVSANIKTRFETVKVRLSDISSFLGGDVPLMRVKGWLTRLGFKVKAKGDILTVNAPDNRSDIHQDVDIIEEVSRMMGFDKLPVKLPIIKAVNIPVDKRPRQIKDKIRQILIAGGMDEIITLSMTNTKALQKSQMGDVQALRIFNPLTQDQELMRPGLLPSMLQVTLTNMNRGQKDLKLFEIGKRYFINGEKETLGLLLTGRRTRDWRYPSKDVVDIFDLKGLLEGFFKALGRSPVYKSVALPIFDPACSAEIDVNNVIMGTVGKIDHTVLNNWDLKGGDIYFAEVFLDKVYALPPQEQRYQPLCGFPAIVRDVSLAVKKEVAYQDIEKLCLSKGEGLLKSVHFIEQYLGNKIQPGYKGLVFSCQYQKIDRTLREEEVAKVHDQILQTLTAELKAILR